MSETSFQKMRADNYALKMALDEIKSKKGDQKVQKKEPKKIVEMLVFEQKKTEPARDKIEEDVFVLKEVVGNKSNLKTAGNVDVFESSENKENTEEDMEVKPRRRGAMFAETVTVHDEEGAKEADLKEEPQEKVSILLFLLGLLLRAPCSSPSGEGAGSAPGQEAGGSRQYGQGGGAGGGTGVQAAVAGEGGQEQEKEVVAGEGGSGRSRR